MQCGWIIVLIYTATLVCGCRKLKYGYDEEKVYYSDAVLFGKVKHLYGVDSDGIQDMEFEVHCIYKGDVQSESIFVTGVGNMRRLGGCPAVTLKEEEEVVLFLKHYSGERRGDRGRQPEFSIEFSPLQGEPDIFLDDLTVACGLTLTNLHERYECYEPLVIDCAKFVEIDEGTTTTPTTAYNNIQNNVRVTISFEGGVYNDVTDGVTASDESQKGGAGHVMSSVLAMLLPFLIVTLGGARV